MAGLAPERRGEKVSRGAASMPWDITTAKCQLCWVVGLMHDGGLPLAQDRSHRITNNCRAVLDIIPDARFPLFHCVSHLLQYFIPGDR